MSSVNTTSELAYFRKMGLNKPAGRRIRKKLRHRLKQRERHAWCAQVQQEFAEEQEYKLEQAREDARPADDDLFDPYSLEVAAMTPRGAAA